MIPRILPLALAIATVSLALGAETWKAPDLAPSDELRLTGIWGEAQSRSAYRMCQPPLDSSDFILADLSQKQKRRYTDYSGDISGRWLGAAAFLAPLYPKPFAAFPVIMAEATSYQKGDGHFGVDQDLPHRDHDRDTAILWGNGRLLIGLIEVFERTGDQKSLEAAKRIGDYFIATDPVFNKPENIIFQQYPNGGAGHRVFQLIDGQPVAFKDEGEEAWWCCSKHWARATVDIARHAVTTTDLGLCINLMIDCEGAVAGPCGMWRTKLRETDDGLHVTLESPVATNATVRIHRPAWAQQGATIEKPAALSLRETPDAWLIDGVWDGTQEIVVHPPTALRSEAAPGNAGVLLRGHDLLVAHRTAANAWLMNSLPEVRPVVLWNAALPSKDGHVVVPASLERDADPNRPEQWKLLELAPLRSVVGRSHDAAWFSFQLRAATPERIAELTGS